MFIYLFSESENTKEINLCLIDLSLSETYLIWIKKIFVWNNDYFIIDETMIIDKSVCGKFIIDLLGSYSRHLARGCVNTCSSSLVLKLTLFVFNHFFLKWLTKKEMYSLFLCLRKHTWQWDHFDWHGVADDRSWSPFDWTKFQIRFWFRLIWSVGHSDAVLPCCGDL